MSDDAPRTLGSRVVLVLFCAPMRQMLLGTILGVLMKWTTPWNQAFIEYVRVRDVELPLGYVRGHIKQLFPTKAAAMLLLLILPATLGALAAVLGTAMMKGHLVNQSLGKAMSFMVCTHSHVFAQ